MLEQLMMVSGKVSPVGQVEYSQAIGTIEVVIPSDVISVCGVVVALGGSHQYGGNGGGLSWRNNIPVTPGETLYYTVTATLSGLYRNGDHITGEILLLASSNGKGGKAADPINDGGGNGGAGSRDQYYRSGGGAGGYTGNGGKYGGQAGWSGSGSGGGGGGGHGRTTGAIRPGGGVGLKGQGANGLGIGSDGPGNPGSGGIGANYGGGGDPNNRGISGLRLIWGPNRAYPSTNTADIL